MDSSDFARLFATAPLGSNRPNTNVGFAAAAKAVKGGRSGPEAEQLVGDVINGKLRRQDGELVSATDQTVHEQIGRYFVRFDVELNEFVPNDDVLLSYPDDKRQHPLFAKAMAARL